MTAEKYRKHAEASRREAERTSNATLKAQWLKMAETWDKLVEYVEQRTKRGGP